MFIPIDSLCVMVLAYPVPLASTVTSTHLLISGEAVYSALFVRTHFHLLFLFNVSPQPPKRPANELDTTELNTIYIYHNYEPGGEPIVIDPNYKDEDEQAEEGR